MKQKKLSRKTYEASVELQRIGSRAVKKAQEEHRKKGIPNVYSLNGTLFYELPNGELTKENPFEK